jgi:hypothetical protein
MAPIQFLELMWLSEAVVVEGAYPQQPVAVAEVGKAGMQSARLGLAQLAKEPQAATPMHLK